MLGAPLVCRAEITDANECSARPKLRRTECDALAAPSLQAALHDEPQKPVLAACKTLASIYIYLDTNTILVQPERHGVIEDRMHGQSEECHEAEEDERDLKQHDGDLPERSHGAHRRRESESRVVVHED